MVCELSSSEHSVRSINDHRALFAASFSRDLAPTSNSLITRYGCVVRKRVVVVSCVARCPRDLLTCARFGNALFATGGKSWEAEAVSYLDETTDESTTRMVGQTTDHIPPTPFAGQVIFEVVGIDTGKPLGLDQTLAAIRGHGQPTPQVPHLPLPSGSGAWVASMRAPVCSGRVE